MHVPWTCAHRSNLMRRRQGWRYCDVFRSLSQVILVEKIVRWVPTWQIWTWADWESIICTLWSLYCCSIAHYRQRMNKHTLSLDIQNLHPSGCRAPNQANTSSKLDLEQEQTQCWVLGSFWKSYWVLIITSLPCLYVLALSKRTPVSLSLALWLSH